MRILLVEDDNNLGHATTEGLRESYAVDWFQTAEEAEEALNTTEFSLIVLDINLPGKSGLSFLRTLRAENNNIPVLLLTARDAIEHRIEGLNTGADDYLVKPFDLDELLARCAALIRRSTGQVSPLITVGDIVYEPATQTLKRGEKIIQLSAKERAILDCLMRNLDHPMSKNKITETIYDWSADDIESNTIEVHISSLRRKLGRNLIKTIRGVGYIIQK
tara:strand:+ start:99 stop:755 length:657 start_codon:yes stop_codon:yes gene_type:complete